MNSKLLRTKFTFSKQAFILIVLCMIGCTSSEPGKILLTGSPTDSKNMVGEKDIYAVFAREQNEIWMLTRDGSSDKTIYHYPREISLLLAEKNGAISSEIAAKLRAKDIGDSTLLTVEVQKLALSPDKTYLAWIESYKWCPGNYCLGQDTIKILRLSDYLIVDVIRTSEIFSEIIWSPNSNYLAYHEETRGRIGGQESFLWMLDMTSVQTKLVGDDIAPLSSWAPDSQSMIVNVRADPYSRKLQGMAFVSIEARTFTPLILPPLNDFNLYVDGNWSPDGTHLAFIGEHSNQSENLNAVFTYDLSNQETINLSKNSQISAFSSPEWSSNSRWIASKAWDGEYFWDLVVMDGKTGTVCVLLESSTVGKIYDWQWSDRTDEIIFTSVDRNDPKRTRYIKIVQIPNGTLLDVELPEEIIEYYQRPEVYYGYIPVISLTW